MSPGCLLTMLLALQGHVSVMNNPPRPKDADIHEEPDASAADDDALSVDANMLAGATGGDESMGAELPETGDSEESNPFRVKRLRPSGAEDLDASSDVVLPSAPSTEPSPPVAAHKRSKLGRFMRTRYARGG